MGIRWCLIVFFICPDDWWLLAFLYTCYLCVILRNVYLDGLFILKSDYLLLSLVPYVFWVLAHQIYSLHFLPFFRLSLLCLTNFFCVAESFQLGICVYFYLRNSWLNTHIMLSFPSASEKDAKYDYCSPWPMSTNLLQR